MTVCSARGEDIANMQGFMPHGMCFLWESHLLLLQAVSDALIAVAYFVIATALSRLALMRPDLPFKTVFWMFALFIVSCGATHVFAIWVIWRPDYWVEGSVKAITAFSSVATACVLLPLLPKALTLRSPRDLELINAELRKAVNALRDIVGIREGEDASDEFQHASISTVSRTLDELMFNLSTGQQSNAVPKPASLFDVVIDVSPSALVLIDKNGIIALVNDSTERLFGYKRSDLLSQPIELIVPHGFHGAHPGWRDSFSAAPQAREMGAGGDLYARRNDGSEIPVEIGLSPIVTVEGTFVLAAITDLSERRTAERLLLLNLESERRFAEFAESEATREHAWSTAFQHAILPAALPQALGYEFDAVYESGLSYAQVGGDWYDAVQLTDGRMMVAIGDVAGGGLEAAIVVGVIRQVMRGIAQLHTNPKLILDTCDHALSLEYPAVYASAWVGIIDFVTETITYASAGHPPPLMISGDGTTRELSDPDTMLIGLRQGHGGKPNVVPIAQDATLVLFTDGIIEVHHDVISGIEQVRSAALEALAKTHRITAETVKDDVIPDGSGDDVAILVVRTNLAQANTKIERWRCDVRNRDDVAGTRDHVVESLRASGYTHEECASAELVFAELIGNVVRHATQSRRVNVVLDQNRPHAVLHILDGGAGFYHVGRLPSDLYAENGRGLFLIGQLTTDFSVSERPEGGSHARAVLRGTSRTKRTRQRTAKAAASH